MTEYGKMLMGNATIRVLRQRAEAGTITAKEMNKLSGEYGKAAGKCIEERLLEEYPNGHVSEDDIRKVISPILKEMHAMVSGAVALLLNTQYEKAGIGIKATIPDYNIKRENELVRDLSQRSFKDELEG